MKIDLLRAELNRRLAIVARSNIFEGLPGTGSFPSKATRGVASIEDGGGADLTDPKDSLGVNEDQEVCVTISQDVWHRMEWLQHPS